MPQRQDEQNQTHSVTEEAHDAGAGERCHRWQVGAVRERQRQVDRTGHHALDRRDLHRICRRKLAGQVVVQAPGQAGAGNGERAQSHTFGSALPGEQHGAGQDRRRSRQQATVDVLLEP